jgi:hypothetical protein
MESLQGFLNTSTQSAITQFYNHVKTEKERLKHGPVKHQSFQGTTLLGPIENIIPIISSFHI